MASEILLTRASEASVNCCEEKREAEGAGKGKEEEEGKEGGSVSHNP